MKRLQIFVPDQMGKKLEEMAKKKALKMSELVRSLLAQIIEGERK